MCERNVSRAHGGAKQWARSESERRGRAVLRSFFSFLRAFFLAPSAALSASARSSSRWSDFVTWTGRQGRGEVRGYLADHPGSNPLRSGFLNKFSADRNSLGPRRGKKQEGLTTTITNSSCEIRTTHTGVYILRRIHRPSPAHGVDYTRPTLPPSLTGEARDGPLRLSRGPPSGTSPRGSSETRPGWSSRVDPAPLPRALAAERRSLRRRARRAASDSRHPSPVCHAGVRHAKGLARAGSCSNSIQTASVHIHAAAARFAIFTIACIAGEWQEETRTETRTDTRTEEPTTYPNGPRTHGWGGSNIRRRARRERIYTSPEHVVEHRPARADQLLAADIVLLAADVIDEGFHLAQPACARASRKSQVHAPTSQVNSTSNE